MTIPNSHVNPLAAAVLGGQTVRPTKAQLDEMEVVRGLQIRTEAVKLAIELVKGHGYTGNTVVAEAVEHVDLVDVRGHRRRGNAEMPGYLPVPFAFPDQSRDLVLACRQPVEFLHALAIVRP